MADQYQLRTGKHKQSRRKRRTAWLVVCLLAILLLIWIGMDIKNGIKPKVVIKQTHAVTTHVAYDKKTTHYNEPDFSIDLPATWKLLPRPEGPYQSFTWSSGDIGSDEQEIEIYQDTIPVNYAVNRALVVEGQTDHIQLSGSASDNCTTFTNNLNGISNQTGVPAKWQGISFLCDRANQARDSIGTSSTDGVNTVILKNQSTGQNHKFFFTYTDHSLNPDYSVFYNALQSFRMQ